MLKIIASYFFIIFGIATLWVSTSHSVMEYLLNKRDNHEWWGLNQLNHGDLASICYLEYLNKFAITDTTSLKHSRYDGPKNTVLFIHGDSYLMNIHDWIFSGISSFNHVGWNNTLHYHLDTSKRNVLVIEVAERTVRSYFGTTEIIDELCDTTMQKKSTAFRPCSTTQGIRYSSFFTEIRVSDFFNKFINQNLECNLFNYRFIIPMFGAKAAINYYLFSRASGDAVISKNKQFLLYKRTLDRTDINSSFCPLSKEEITKLVNNFNTIYDYYTATGFKEIYLSIIPSTVTVVEPEGYNNLIPAIQNDPRLKMKVIDAYDVLKRSPEKYFLRGDTHWNVYGQQKWVDMVNGVITKEANSK